MKLYYLLILVVTACAPIKNMENQKNEINSILDNWHKAAAEANYEKYFGAMSEKSIFIGTDATENWNKKEFQAFAKPYFDKGKAWSLQLLNEIFILVQTGKQFGLTNC